MAYTDIGLSYILLQQLLSGKYIGLGVDGVEVSGKGYTRMPCSAGSFTYDSATHTAQNTKKIKFPESTAAWGNVNTLFIFTAQTGGVCLFEDTLDTAANVSGPDFIVKFDVGYISITLYQN